MADELTEKIIGAAVEVHRLLGPGLLESVYEDALCHEMTLRKINFERQKAVDVIYKAVRIQGQRIDLVVEGQVVCEIKAARVPPELATAQLLSYLKSTGLRRGLLINFCESKLVDGIKRVSL